MSRYVLGVDVGGTKIAVCGSNHCGGQRKILRVPSYLDNPSTRIEEHMLSAIREYIEKYENGQAPAMIGFGLKDAVDREKGIWITCPCKNGTREVNLAKHIDDALGVPSILDNDVHAATLAEMKFGAGRKYSDFLYINVGTGISMGVVVENRLLRGAGNYAGEFGHISIDPTAEKCGFCGMNGCLESIASGQAICRQAEQAAKSYPGSILAEFCRERERIDSGLVFRAADRGDAEARRIGERVLNALLLGACSAINIFNPEAVIFGGGVMSDGWIAERLFPRIADYTIPTTMEAVKEISLSDIGADYVGVIGAVLLAEYEYSGKL